MIVSCVNYTEKPLNSNYDEFIDYTYIAEYIQIPNNIGEVNNFVYYNNIFFFTATIIDYPSIENGFLSSGVVCIYSINIDGTNLTQLIEYSSSSDKPDYVGGMTSIEKMVVDDEGNLWIVERQDFYTLNLPYNFYDRNNLTWWEYMETYKVGSAIHKLDCVGNELFYIDVSSFCLNEMHEILPVTAFLVNNTSNDGRRIYLCLEDFINSTQIIYVLDDIGNMLFKLETDVRFSNFVSLPENAVGFRDESHLLQTIDVTTDTFGNTVEIPDINGLIYTGGNGFDILINDNLGIYGYTINSKEVVRLLTWQEIHVTVNNVEDIFLLHDGRILCVNRTSHGADTTSCELIILAKTLKSEIPEKTLLTLAVINLSPSISNAVAEFNRKNPNYSIEIKTYSEYSGPDDWNGGFTRLTSEINAGMIPDILDISELPYVDYANSGILADLYPFIDADTEFSRDSFVQAAIKSAEIDDRLYMISPMFFVYTIVGHPTVVGSNMGWNIDEFQSVINKNLDATQPLGSRTTKINFLLETIRINIDEYINWKEKTVRFDTPDFIKLLEFTNNLPLEIERSNILVDTDAIATGQQIMQQTGINSFHAILYLKEMFGGDVVFKGFPGEKGVGHALFLSEGLSITESSANKEAAWNFIKILLNEDWQIDNLSGFPTNQVAFHHTLINSLENSIRIDSSAQQLKLTQAEIDMTLELINSATGMAKRLYNAALWDIISESASDYLNGISDAKHTANVIQRRISLYVSEHS